MMRRIQILPLIIILLACNSSDSPPGPELSVEIRTLDKFDQESQAFTQGEKITIEFSITNRTSEEKRITSNTTQTVGYLIKDERGDIVLDRSSMLAGQMFTSIVLNAGETEIVRLNWDQTIDRDGNLIGIGNYAIEGWFRGSGSEPAAIDISII
jgi:hypothetical protein